MRSPSPSAIVGLLVIIVAVYLLWAIGGKPSQRIYERPHAAGDHKQQ